MTPFDLGIMDKLAAAKEPGYWEKQRIAGQAMRGHEMEMLRGYARGAGKGALVGAGIAGGAAAAAPHHAARAIHAIARRPVTAEQAKHIASVIGRKRMAGYAALIGAAGGLGIGGVVGQYRKQKEILKRKGIDISHLGFKVKVNR